MQAFKKSTYLTGLPVSKNPHAMLRALYNRILATTSLMPESAAYRRHTDEIVRSRLDAVNRYSNIPDLEKAIDCGQIEEVIVQAQREYDLARNFLNWRPWEPLVEPPPKNQWKWPV